MIMRIGGFNIDRRTALFIFFSLITITIMFSLALLYYVIYKEQFYLDVFYLMGVIFFSLLGYYWEKITAFFDVNTGLFWLVFTLGFFFYYLGKEHIVPQISSFLLASMFTYLVVALKGLHEFFKKGYHISPNRKKEK